MLVFGAGTNYALLLISRYREELGRNESHRDALDTAVRRAGPAIIASNATVVLALLTLLFASSPSTRSLGVQAAAGLVVAAVFVLLVLPSALGLFGRKLFWPFIPAVGATPLTDSGIWHRVAAAVARRPARVAVVSIGALALLCTGLFGTPVGLSQTEQFRVQAESVSGYDTLADHFPSGLTDPARVIASTDRAAEVQRAITGTPGRHLRRTRGHRTERAEPVVGGAGRRARLRCGRSTTIDALRDSVHQVDRAALVGGSDATARDVGAAAAHDRAVVIPAILAVVLLVLYALLRSALAPLVLVGVTVLSALAALGLGGWASVHLFGFPGLDNTAPLFAFLFLVALGVDYTIFLVTRAREETPEHGTRHGIVRAVSATGAVISSAGIVLAAVFCVLGVLPLIVLTQVGIIVGLGILLDTFLVRTVIIPALFTLIGPKIWWPALRRTADPERAVTAISEPISRTERTFGEFAGDTAATLVNTLIGDYPRTTGSVVHDRRRGANPAAAAHAARRIRPHPRTARDPRVPGVRPSPTPSACDVYLVTRYEDVKTVLSDHRASPTADRPASSSRARRSLEEEQPRNRAGNLLGLDPPEHQRLRRMLTPEFTIRRMQAAATPHRRDRRRATGRDGRGRRARRSGASTSRCRSRRW